MKKLIIAFFIIALILPGCSLNKKKETPPTPQNTQGEQKQEPDKKEQQYVIGPESPVKNAKEWTDRYKPYEGVYVQKKGDFRLLLISQGEKFSEGYKVNVKSVEEKQDNWTVEADIIEPQEEDYSGNSVYPHELVSIIDDGKPIVVVKSPDSNSEMSVESFVIPEGKTLAVSKNFIILTPTEGEKISSPVTIKGKARVFEATFRIMIEDGHDILADKVLMSDAGAPAWGNFNISLPYEKETSPSGSIIFSYENMETGKMIEELILPVTF